MFGRFKKNRKKEFSYSPEEMKEKLEVLEDAISDVGYWNWWTADFPKLIMLEFGGTQIWTKPNDNESPSGQIGITFQNPYSVSFLTREQYKRDTPENWADLLHNDKLDQPEIEHGQFTFTDLELIEQIIKESKKVETVFGNKPTDPDFKNAEFKFGFWAINFGCVISCESVNVVSHDGEISLDEVENRKDKWWKYWKEYWEKRDSNNPLPKDYACEVTIPAGQKITIKE
ncbi:hypothetical protein DNU06_17180 [Putridiphycobacter roseus]|uniref:Uncharacterized protein n=1 Tax=Putridiphycobacter roseus TaxID=2219161 RepID=A0A2W1NLM1_9FLAO|nr:hypothetical protein [Putridiphycobacter roseus]PZE15608.1 hypothetical protein DNU06_17180 [Putridiphycobacter roseus]